MLPATIFYLLYGFYIISFLWDLYLSFRQYFVYKRTEKRPDNITEIISEEDFAKARAYKLEKMNFGFITNVFSSVQLSVVLFLNILPLLWNLTGNLALFIWPTSGEIFHSMIFSCVSTLIETTISFPFSFYDTFVIEQKHGFNKETIPFFFKDRLKKLIVVQLLTLPLVAGILWIIQVGGPYFFVYVWLFLSLMIFVFMTIYPEYIAPLFDKYTPLPASELKTKIEELASRINYPLKKIYVVEGSKRSAHSNAYLYGFWNNKRIVLYDTLLSGEFNALMKKDDKNGEQLTKSEEPKTEDAPTNSESDEKEKLTNEEDEALKKKARGMSDDEVVAVIGHELGHWKLSHVFINLVITEVNILLMLFVFSFFYRLESIYGAFGFHTQPTLIGLYIIFQFVLAPYNEVMGIVLTFITRRAEFQADEFSAKLGFSRLLQTGLIKISTDNLSLPIDDWLYSMVNHSHPPVPERIEALKKHQ